MAQPDVRRRRRGSANGTGLGFGDYLLGIGRQSQFAVSRNKPERGTYTWSNSLLACVKMPRTDVNGLNTFTYDSGGALIAMTNALGQTTRITQHLRTPKGALSHSEALTHRAATHITAWKNRGE